MKKVTLFHTEFFFSGGAEHTLLETIEFLQNSGYSVECYAPYVNKKTCFPDLIQEYPISSLLPNWLIKLPLPREIFLLIAAMLAPFLMRKFKSSDLYYGANQAGPFFAYVAWLINRKPYIVYMPYPQSFLYPRQIDTEFGEQSDMGILIKIFIKLIKPFFKKIDLSIMKHAQEVITEGTYAQTLFQNIYQRNCINCPPGAIPISVKELNTINRFEGTVNLGGITISKPYILLTNRHMPKKKFEYAIYALDYLKSKYKDVNKLVITGSQNAYTNELMKLIKKKNLENEITFTGYTTEKDTLYKNAAVYIYPAPEEDFGKGIIQSMACGVPVIAWNKAGPSGIVKNNVTGYVVSPFNEEEFAEKIHQLKVDIPLNKSLGSAARKDVEERFSATTHTKTILNIINGIRFQLNAVSSDILSRRNVCKYISEGIIL